MVAKSERITLKFLQQYRFGLLFFALILLFFYGAVIEVFAPRLHGVAIRIAVGGILGYLIIASTIVVASTDRSSGTLLFLAAAAVLLELLDLWLLNDTTQIVGHIAGMLFLGFVVLRLLKVVFESRQITTDIIFASLCAYLLLAVLWMYAYSLLELFDSGAFSYPLLGDSLKRIMRLGAEPAGIEFYFSLVTMTTLGYGDIVPKSPAARSLATLQAVLGQLYLAVLVARLVGMHVADATRPRD